MPEGQIGLFRQLDGSMDRAGWIPHKLYLEHFSGLPTGGKGNERAGKIAQMETVIKIISSAIGRFPDFHKVCSILRGDHAERAVLQQEIGVIGSGHFKTVGIENGNIGIKQRTGQSNGFNFQRNSLPFGCVEFKIVHILAFNQPVNGPVEGNFLSFLKRGVRFFFVKIWIGSDPECFHRADTRFRAQSHFMLAQTGGLGNTEFYTYRLFP